jgi:DNA-binding transcriptional regulator PaaX
MAREMDISQEILEYLNKHPEASDTLEGIAEWWLLTQRITCEIKRFKAAVFKLIEEGWLIESKSKNSNVYYRLNSEKRREITPPVRTGKDIYKNG